MALPGSRRRFDRALERALPVGHCGIALQIATDQVGLDGADAETVRSDGKPCVDAAIPHRHFAVRPVDVFGLHGSLRGKILQTPRTFALELGRTLANVRLARERPEFAEIREAVVI